MLLTQILPKALVKLAIDYFNDINLYSILVSTHNWLLRYTPQIAVDSARLYLLTKSKSLKGLGHSLENTKEDECRLIEFGDPQWSDYDWFSSSHGGRYVSFSHKYKPSTDLGGLPKCGTKWLTQIKDAEDKKPSRIVFDGEDSNDGILSRDGQKQCSYSYEMNLITRVYRVEEEAGMDPIGFMKFKLNGAARAVSGKGSHVMMTLPENPERHNIGKDASKLVCQLDATGFVSAMH